MSGYIRNEEELISHGERALRETALRIVEHALKSVDPYLVARRLIQLHGDTLHVGENKFDLSKCRHLYVLGAGKASLAIAKALDEILAERIHQGLVIVKSMEKQSPKYISLREAAHPVPDEAGFVAAKEVLRIAAETRSGDIVFCIFTGGSSALMSLPVPDITFHDKVKVNETLLSCGATIREINAVRKHLSAIKGGRLALALFPATVVNLTVSDVTGDPLDYITGPTVPDTSSFSDAVAVLDKYSLWGTLPDRVTRYLQNHSPEKETPKEFGDHASLLQSFILADGNDLCQAAKCKAEELGFSVKIISTTLEGESRDEGTRMGEMARRIKQTNACSNRSCAFIAGGETTVTIKKDHGDGGPNQEFALAAAMELDGCRNVVVAAMDTDGTDGPTEFAGGLVDYSTVHRAKAAGLDPIEKLTSHDAAAVLESTGDALKTGQTGTNVNDLKMVLIG
jgi:hydroxypyruvate reductase/glycerate 2-kinase